MKSNRYDSCDFVDPLSTEELKEALENLRRSNTDLEHFAYLVAHDLQGPLRAISSFSELIRERVDAARDPVLAEYIGILIKSSREMKSFIEAILSYSKLSAGTHLTEVVDLNEIVEEILRLDLADLKGLGVSYKSLPKVTGNRVLLKRLLANLIENAFKFKKPNHDAHVHISSEKEGTLWKFGVQDNGIGVDADNQNKVFRLFARCHAQRTSGMGIGLAVCKKIIDIHGGKIWLTSTPNEGSTFHFTLPEVQIESNSKLA